MSTPLDLRSSTADTELFTALLEVRTALRKASEAVDEAEDAARRSGSVGLHRYVREQTDGLAERMLDLSGLVVDHCEDSTSEWQPAATMPDDMSFEAVAVVDTKPLSTMCSQAGLQGGEITVLQRNGDGTTSLVRYTHSAGKSIEHDIPGDWTNARYGFRPRT